MQDELTRAIVSALQLHLTPSGGADIAKRGTASVEAYNLYLQGRFFYEKRSEDGLVKAAEAFTSAIKLDSNYAAAYSGLADSYSLLGTFGFRAPLAMLPLAKPAALRALALDSMLAEAHTSLGFIHLFYEFDYDAGNRELTRAIELDPHYAPARLFRSWYYVAAGRTDEAVREIERAQAEDPLSLIINTRHGTMLFWARRYDEAKDQLRRAIVLDSTYLLAHAQLSRAYLMLGNCKQSIAEAFMSNLAVGNYESANLSYAMAHCGDTERRAARAEDRARAGEAPLRVGGRDRAHVRRSGREPERPGMARTRVRPAHLVTLPAQGRTDVRQPSVRTEVPSLGEEDAAQIATPPGTKPRSGGISSIFARTTAGRGSPRER